MNKDASTAAQTIVKAGKYNPLPLNDHEPLIIDPLKTEERSRSDSDTLSAIKRLLETSVERKKYPDFAFYIDDEFVGDRKKEIWSSSSEGTWKKSIRAWGGSDWMSSEAIEHEAEDLQILTSLAESARDKSVAREEKSRAALSNLELNDLGAAIILFSLAMVFLNVGSGRVFLHPLIAGILLIGGVGFVVMHWMGKNGWKNRHD